MTDKTPMRLGRGLSALIPPSSPSAAPQPAPADAPMSPAPRPEGIQEVLLAQIEPNALQPRMVFQEAALDDLAASINRHGVLQPVMLRPRGGGRYELVAGERRFRAAERAGLTRIPAVIRSLTDEESLTVALIENIQREDLNPIEAARGYRQLMEEYGLTQKQLGEQIGKKQSTISNSMRLLNLPQEIQDSISSGQITTEHGKVLLSVVDQEKQRDIWQNSVTLEFSVKQMQQEVTLANFISPVKKNPSAKKQSTVPNDVHWSDFLNRFQTAVGMKTSINPRPSGGGTITIGFASVEDAEALLERLEIR